MNPIERVNAVLAGQNPDRPPFSFWYHFPPSQIAGNGAVQAHLEHLHGFELDVLKVMNDNPYPHPRPITCVQDLEEIAPLKGDENGFGAQLTLISALRAALDTQVYMPTTIFNAWTTLRLLVAPPKEHLPPVMDPAADAPSRWIRDAWRENPTLVARALQTIGDNLAWFAARCVAAGADGVYLSVRDDWVDTPDTPDLYERIMRRSDLDILAAVSEAPFNVLHVCGKARNFRAFAGYPVAVLHWADRAAGPAIRDAAAWLKPAPWGGVDHMSTLITGTPEQVRAEVADALHQAGDRPIMIAPGCTFDPSRVPKANLQAIGEAVRQEMAAST
jgi:uroporphyrinogen decarboxylase